LVCVRIDSVPNESFCQALQFTIGGITCGALIDTIRYKRYRTLLARKVPIRVIARYVAKKGELVTAQVSIMSLPPTMPIAVSVIAASLFHIIIDIGSFHHLREIQRHAVQHGPGLSVCVDMFISGPC